MGDWGGGFGGNWFLFAQNSVAFIRTELCMASAHRTLCGARSRATPYVLATGGRVFRSLFIGWRLWTDPSQNVPNLIAWRVDFARCGIFRHRPREATTAPPPTADSPFPKGPAICACFPCSSEQIIRPGGRPRDGNEETFKTHETHKTSKRHRDIQVPCAKLNQTSAKAEVSLFPPRGFIPSLVIC